MRIRVVVALASCVAVPLLAQDSTDASPNPLYRRNPTTAAVLGALIPGLGHVYSTEYLRGVGIYLGTSSLIGVGTMVYVIDRCTFAFLNPDPCDPGPQWPHRTLGTLMVAGGVAAWVASAIDAPRAARRANRLHGFRSAQWAPLVEPRRDGKPGVALGLAATW
jgi:hypothetical protein